MFLILANTPDDHHEYTGETACRVLNFSFTIVTCTVLQWQFT